MVSIKIGVSYFNPVSSGGNEFHHFILFQPLMFLQNGKLKDIRKFFV